MVKNVLLFLSQRFLYVLFFLALVPPSSSTPPTPPSVRVWNGKSGLVDARDLASGFFLLCSGNKSVKLASAFRLLDEDGDDQLTREGVWRFLRYKRGLSACLYCTFFVLFVVLLALRTYLSCVCVCECFCFFDVFHVFYGNPKVYPKLFFCSIAAL